MLKEVVDEKSTTMARPSTVDATKMSRVATISAVAGNILEWYSFTVYGYLAIILARQFFPSKDETVSLLAAFAAFGVGFVGRPLGAVVLGRLGDLRGRKAALLLSIFLMAGASIAVGILPTYARIGIAAPILLVVARLAEGVSAGGEWGGAAAFLIEWAPKSRRGFVGSLHQVGTFGGLLLGSAVVALISTLLGPRALESWGWRIPFLLGGILGLVGMYMRRNIEETPFFRDTLLERQQVRSAAKRDPVLRPFAQTFGIVILWGVTPFAVFSYMPTWAQKFAHLSRSESLWSNTIATAVCVGLIPLAGYVSDKVGRKPLLAASCAGIAVLSIPLFQAILFGKSFAALALAEVAFAILIALIAGPGPATIAELFSTRSRSKWISIGAALSITIFGGFAPFIATLLIERTGSPIAPACYLIAAALLTSGAVSSLRETFRDELR